MSSILEFIRETIPATKDIPDDQLTEFLGESMPGLRKAVPEFDAEFRGVRGKGLRSELNTLQNPEQPDELFIGQEARGIGRAAKRGVLAGQRAMNVIGLDRAADELPARQQELEDAQAQLQEFDASGQSNPQWRNDQMGRIATLEQELKRRSAWPAQSMAGIDRTTKAMAELPPSPDMAGLQTDFWKTLATNPIETIATVSVESLPQSIAGTVAGAAVGGPPGMVVGTAANSFGVEYANSLLETATEQGLDISTPEGMGAFFGNPDLLSKARTKALKRSVPVAAFDALSAGLAGRFLKPALGQGVKEVLKASGKELGMQAGAGMAGETAGQLASEGRITSVPDIVLEGLAEFGSGPVEVASNILTERESAARVARATETGIPEPSGIPHAKAAAAEAGTDTGGFAGSPTITTDEKGEIVRTDTGEVLPVTEEVINEEPVPDFTDFYTEPEATALPAPDEAPLEPAEPELPAAEPEAQAEPAGPTVSEIPAPTDLEPEAQAGSPVGPSAGNEGVGQIEPAQAIEQPTKKGGESNVEEKQGQGQTPKVEHGENKPWLQTPDEFMANTPHVSDDDVTTAGESNQDIVKRTRPGEERESAFSARAEASERLSASLRPGDTLTTSDGEVFIVDEVVGKNAVIFKGQNGISDPRVFITASEVTLHNGQRVHDPSATITRAEGGLAPNHQVARVSGHEKSIRQAIRNKEPVSAIAAEAYELQGYLAKHNYVKRGEFYVPEAMLDTAPTNSVAQPKPAKPKKSNEEAEARKKVTDVSPENGDVTLENGERFGTQVINDGQTIYVEKLIEADLDADFAPEPEAEPAKEAEPLTLDAPESVEEQKAREAKEKEQAEAKRQKAKVAEKAAKPLVGTTGDLGQMNLDGTKDDLFQDRISTKGSKAGSIFEMEDGDLADLLEDQFGTPSAGTGNLAFGRGGSFRFPSYDAFKSWMDERYGERDHEGMRLAFAEAPTENKVKYIKENIKGTPHKKAWVTNLATGSPLPAEDPPVTRTTQRPTPSGTPTPTSPGASGGPARPGAPPTPPRPSPNLPGHRKFDITALVQLLRQFSKFPRINERLRSAYGRYLKNSEVVELKQRLLWDTGLAERVLGHEIGHFIDLAIAAKGDGKQFAGRLIPLWDLRKQVWTKTELKNEARSLSREWRGNFVNGDRYRDTAVELFADFMSAMFKNPEWVNQKYPKLFDAFQQLRDGKPEFKAAYREIETWLQGETMARELRDQDEAAIERTFDILQTAEEKNKPSIKDRIMFAVMSIWQRAYEKEGKPRSLGTSITDELEYVKTWAAKENALFQDDLLKLVMPELNKVDTDPAKARKELLSYSKAKRTIGERRAAGIWIENNPNEARELLQGVIDLDPSLRIQFGNSVANAADTELYDLAASIFREIYDRGEGFVDRIKGKIDDMDLGVTGEAAMTAFNVRGKLLNPGGMTPETAAKVIADQKAELGPERFKALQKAARELRNLLFEVQSKMHDEGLISDKNWTELIEPNKDNYVPYAVLDYFEGKVRAGIMPQKGTAKDVADVLVSVQLKVASMNAWRQQQQQTKLLRDVYSVAVGGPMPVGRRLKRSRDIDAIRSRSPNDNVSRAVYWVNGQPHLQEFHEDQGKMLEKAMDVPAFYEHIEWITEASDLTHKIMQLYTQFSVPFLLWRNPVRGARTAGMKVGFGRVAKQMTPAELKENVRLAKNYAKAAFGAEMLPEVRDLVDRQILLPPRLSQAMVRDASSLRDLIANNTIMASMVRFANRDKSNWWKRTEPTRKAVELSEKLFSAYEAFEKIYNYRAALARGDSPERAGAIARRAGIPKPGVGGKWSMFMEVWFPWTRVSIQGHRASYDMLRDPESRGAYLTRFMVSEALPRVAKVAIATGVIAGTIKWATGDDDEEDGKKTVMAEFFRRVSPYKMALDDTIPLYFYDPRTGKVHYLWELENGDAIPSHYEAVSWRIPASEEGRMWGVLLYNLMINMPGARDDLGKPGDTMITAAGKWAANYALPGSSPVIETGSNLGKMMFQGVNPLDAYRNAPAANEQLFDAGGVQRAEAIAGYLANQTGSAGELAGVLAANFGLIDHRALNAMNTRLPGDQQAWNQKIPFLKTAISHDNYAQYRTEKMATLELERVRVRARLMMPEDVRGLYDFYYRNLKRRDKLTGSEKQQMVHASAFVHDVWGDLTKGGEPNPDSFYSKAAAAASDDASAELKATFQRDISTAAGLYLEGFKQARQSQ